MERWVFDGGDSPLRLVDSGLINERGMRSVELKAKGQSVAKSSD
jgi:hypothetical protein